MVDGPLLDQAIKSVPGIVYDLTISWTAGGADDRIALHDGTAVTAAKKIALRLGATAGVITMRLAEVGREFSAGIFLNAQLTAAAKVTITIGYD